MGRYIIMNENNKVTSIRMGAEIVHGEVESELGECGQIKQLDNSFITPIPAIVVPVKTAIELRLEAMEAKLDSMLIKQDEIKVMQIAAKAAIV